MKKVSVVIPCYNAERTLERCIRSLKEQTLGMEAMELIFINDASEDRTYEMLLEFEKQFPESVLVVNFEKNMRQGAGRNAGIRYATAEYVGFVDADDYVEPEMFEVLYRNAAAHHCDMSGCGYYKEKEGAVRKAVADSLPTERAVTVESSEIRKNLILYGTNTGCWARIYRTDFLRENNLFFPERVLYEDNYWQPLVNMKVKKYFISAGMYYHYIIYPDSSVNNPDRRSIEDSLTVDLALVKYLRQQGQLYLFHTEWEGKFVKSFYLLNLMTMYLEWGQIPEDLYLFMRKQVKDLFPDCVKNPYLWGIDQGFLRETLTGQWTSQDLADIMKYYLACMQQGNIDAWQYGNEQKKQWDEYQDVCFEFGLHAKELQESGDFDELAGELIAQAEAVGRKQEGISCLEEMASHRGDYQRRYQSTRPILIYKSESICYDVLNDFAERFKEALTELGENVEIFDVTEKGIGALADLTGKSYKAVVGFQTYLFSILLEDGSRNIHDLILGPKFNFIFDHPLWMRDHLEKAPEDYYVLTHGEDYKEFVDVYFSRVKRCFVLPPAGILPEDQTERAMRFDAACGTGNAGESEKKYDLTFVGTYHDYRERLAAIRSLKREDRFLANRFLLIMKQRPSLTAEAAFAEVLACYGKGGTAADETEFKDKLFELRQVCFAVMTYYREKVIKTILDAGIRLDVYGESWKKSPFVAYPNLICHEEVTVEESLQIWQQSRLSLNIMSWHKGGFTERVANMMLCGTVVVSDESLYLKENFGKGELALFSLERLEELPGMIRGLLNDPERQRQITQAAMRTAREKHTWKKRAEEFLTILQEKLD